MPFLAFFPSPAVFWLTAAVPLLEQIEWPDDFNLASIIYLPFLLFALAWRSPFGSYQSVKEAPWKPLSASLPVDPRRYFETVAPQRERRAERAPVCLYLEVTNRCNLLCTTCPRTYVELEPPADMSWELFTSIVDQSPGLQRAVLHGVGEPMLVKSCRAWCATSRTAASTCCSTPTARC